MKCTIPFLVRLAIVCSLGLNGACSWATEENSSSLLVGCTPGEEQIKSQLGIPAEILVDFIKWDLSLDNQTRHSFVLNIVYGESQPNTLGFKGGGQKKSYRGEFHISKEVANEIYHLKSNGFQTEIALMKLSANIFHLLTPQKELMIGNGGWSYTLNNRAPASNLNALPTLTNSGSILNDTSLQVIYDGRTPCLDFAGEHNLTVSPSCFKLKWKLILNRDPKTFAPAGYTLKRTNSRETDLTGNWTIVKGTTKNPNAIVLQLDPNKPQQTISLLVGDKNVLFFLHKDNSLFTGNDNFSFTLNRRQISGN